MYPLDRLYGLQNRSGHGGRGKLFPLPGIELPTIESLTNNFKDWTDCYEIKINRCVRINLNILPRSI
jgi:hypothetical protein